MEVVKQFTLRLEEAEASRMDALKKLTGRSPDNGAIKHLIRNFEELNKRFLNEQKEKNDIRYKYDALQKKVNTFLSSFEDLKGAAK